MRRVRAGRFMLALVLVAIATGTMAWAAMGRRPTPAAPSAAQVQSLLPAGSTLHSLVRIDLDGRPPLEAAALAAIPQFPGTAESAYTGIVVTYDLWRRRFRQVYTTPLPAPIPLSVDAGRLLDARDAVIFAGLREDGSRAYRVVGRLRGRLQVIHEATIPGLLRVDGSILVEEGAVRRALAWDGRAFRERAPPPAATPPPGITWRFNARQGTVAASSSVVHLQLRQTVRVVQSGGGPTPIIIPDLRLDVVEQGYRARTPGTYTIRVLLPGAADEQGFTLRLVVE